MENNTQCAIPCFSSPHFDRLIFYTDNKLERNYLVWMMFKKGISRKKIATFLGYNHSSVISHAVLNLQAIGDDEDIIEYFRLGLDFVDIFHDHELDPDKYVLILLNYMYRFGIRTKDDVKNLPEDQLNEFLSTYHMKRIGPRARDIFVEYWDQLRKN